MNRRRIIQKLSISGIAIVATFLLSQWNCEASPQPQNEQQQTQSQQQQPPPPDSADPGASKPDAPDPLAVGRLPIKRRKVWSNDDMAGLRTAADNYRVEKEQKAAAEAAAAAKQAAIQAAAQPAPDVRLPETVEETQRMLKDTEDDIKEETLILGKIRDEMATAPEEQQADKQRQLDRLTLNIEKLRRNSKALQDHLQVLTLKPEADNPSPPSPTSR